MLLRQNPHNVHEWLKRVKLFEEKPREVKGQFNLMHTLILFIAHLHAQVINTFTEAVQTVSIEKAVGKPQNLWIQFAKFYEEHEQITEVSECEGEK